MSPRSLRIVAVAATVLILLPGLASAAVEALFDLSSPASAPFPSDRFTVDDHDQKTGLRVRLPKPGCVARPSDCADIDVINTLDGFNLQPRISIPFSGPIDVSTVSSSTVFLVRLGYGRGHSDDPIGSTRCVGSRDRHPRHAESDELLDQHARYLLVVTDGVRVADGHRVKGEALEDFLDGDKRRHILTERASATIAGISGRRSTGSSSADTAWVVASVFSTLSATGGAREDPSRDQSNRGRSRPRCSARSSSATLARRRIEWSRQVGTNPSVFVTSTFPVAALGIFPGAVGSVAFGRFESPDWETPQKFIRRSARAPAYPKSRASTSLFSIW